jgi:hypothetical protein
MLCMSMSRTNPKAGDYDLLLLEGDKKRNATPTKSSRAQNLVISLWVRSSFQAKQHGEEQHEHHCLQHDLTTVLSDHVYCPGLKASACRPQLMCVSLRSIEYFPGFSYIILWFPCTCVWQ